MRRQTLVISVIIAIIIITSLLLLLNYWKNGRAETATLSKNEAILLLQNKYPELKVYPSDTLPPRSIVTEQDKDIWYIAFIQNGSGRPIIEAKCYSVNGKNITETRSFKPKPDDLKFQFSARNCTSK